MKKAILVSVIAITVIISATTLVLARELPRIGNTERNMFKNMVQAYFRPAITGWGIGLNTQQDSYLVARFHAVTVKTLPRNQIVQILREAKAGDVTSWTDVRNRIQAAIEANGTTVFKGRIQINKQQYILTNVTRNETTFNATIRERPDYSACVTQNISAEDCEVRSTSVGNLFLKIKTAELEQGKDRVWAGTMNFNNTEYTFVALVNPRVGG